jgi:RNA polymerase-binding transcription factor DksA
MPRATSTTSSAGARKAGAGAAKPSATNSTRPAAPRKGAAVKAATPARPAVKKAVPAKKSVAAAPVNRTKKGAVPAKSGAKKSAPKAARPSAKKVAPAKKSTPAKAPARAAAKKVAPAKKAAPKVPTRRKPTAAELKFFEAQRLSLVDERATYLRQAESLKAEADSLAEQREPGDVQFDEESGEGDTLAVERERDLALSAQARAAIEEIDHALAKIELGTYGICEVSGLPIPRERLKAIPWARERVEYKVGGFGRR